MANLGLQGSHIFGDLVQILDTEPHHSLEAPINIRIGVVLVENDLDELLVCETFDLFKHQVTLGAELFRARLCFREECAYKNGEDLIHALAVAKLNVILSPEVQHV